MNLKFIDGPPARRFPPYASVTKFGMDVECLCLLRLPTSQHPAFRIGIIIFDGSCDVLRGLQIILLELAVLRLGLSFILLEMVWRRFTLVSVL